MAAVGRLRAELGAQTANVAWLWTELQQMVWSNAAEQSWVENQSRAEQSAHPKSKWMTSPVKHKFPILARVASEATAAVAQSVVAWVVWALAEPYALPPAGALDAEPVLARPPPDRTGPGTWWSRPRNQWSV